MVASGAAERKETHTDKTGHFRIVLPPGHYTVEATNVGGYQSTDSADLLIGTSPVQITLNVDSGIR